MNQKFNVYLVYIKLLSIYSNHIQTKIEYNFPEDVIVGKEIS